MVGSFWSRTFGRTFTGGGLFVYRSVPPLSPHREREAVHVGRQHGGSDRFGEGESRLLPSGGGGGPARQLGVLWVLPLGPGDR